MLTGLLVGTMFLLQYIEATYNVQPLEFLRQQINAWDLFYILILPLSAMIVASFLSSLVTRKTGLIRLGMRLLNCFGRFR